MDTYYQHYRDITIPFCNSVYDVKHGIRIALLCSLTSLSSAQMGLSPSLTPQRTFLRLIQFPRSISLYRNDDIERMENIHSISVPNMDPNHVSEVGWLREETKEQWNLISSIQCIEVCILDFFGSLNC